MALTRTEAIRLVAERATDYINGLGVNELLDYESDDSLTDNEIDKARITVALRLMRMGRPRKSRLSLYCKNSISETFRPFPKTLALGALWKFGSIFKK